jgi:hypothetical protein
LSVLLGLLLISCTALRILRPVVCLAVYAAGTLYLALLGLMLDRLVQTFGFLLLASIFLFVVEPASRHRVDAHHDSQWPAVVLVSITLATLYLGAWVFPSTLRTTYLAEVRPNRAALKISDDPQLDRSLYLTHEGTLVYTRIDAVPRGGVLRYRALADPTLKDNASYLKPNAFVEPTE